MKVHTIPILQDNYAYALEYGEGGAIVVDPSEGEAVRRVLESRRLRLTHILVTHSHSDHTAGVADLKARTGCEVVGSDRRVPGLDRLVTSGKIAIGPLDLTALPTPGHTATAVCWLIKGEGSPAYLFTGDTLFVSGCGRLFQSDAQTMYRSLCRLADLPGDTQVYPGHEYTEENCRFALAVAADYPPFEERLREVRVLLDAGCPTVPTTLEIEQRANPFLLADSPVIRKTLDLPDAPAWQVFAELRRRKDSFG